MDKEKEIKEMKQVLVDYAMAHDLCFLFDAYRKNAETLYNAGYRKAEDVKREAIKEFAERLEAKAVESCDIYTCGMVVTIGDIRELVKEYLG